MPEPIRGLADLQRFFDTSGVNARTAVVGVLNRTGQQAQRGMVSRLAATTRRRTGTLEGAIKYRVDDGQLRLRVGMLDAKDNPFYGRILNFGRSGQTVWVPPRGRRKGYYLRVGAITAKLFVTGAQADLTNALDANLATFWDDVLD